ncbi:MAG: hypothetical protein ACF8XB_12610 [Planctomycetota bacterium JB042]
MTGFDEFVAAEEEHATTRQRRGCSVCSSTLADDVRRYAELRTAGKLAATDPTRFHREHLEPNGAAFSADTLRRHFKDCLGVWDRVRAASWRKRA